MINITEKATTAISRFIQGSEEPVSGLRVAVVSGGCSGFQYSMRLETEAAPDDTVLEFGLVKVFVDPASAPMLNGVTVDFVETIESSGFRIENPNASASCGCGNSFTA